MFGSLIRWLGHGAGSERSRRGAPIAPRFTPRLEGLEGRAAPAHMGGWLGEEIPSCATLPSAGDVMPTPAHVGEEIPQVHVIGKRIPSAVQPGYDVSLTEGAGHRLDLMGGAAGGIVGS